MLQKFLVQENVRDMRWGGCHDFQSQLFFLSTKSFRKGTLLSFTKSPVSKKFMDKGGMVSRLSVTIAFPHSTKSFRRGTLLCFRKFRVSKRLKDKSGGGGV